MNSSKKLNKKEFITLFSLALNEDVEKILFNKNKISIGGGTQYSKFYQQIQQVTDPHSCMNGNYNELQCILKFFNDKAYNKVDFPQNYEIVFSLLKFSQQHYKPLNYIKKYTDSCVNFLGDDLFLQTVFQYIKNNDVEYHCLQTIDYKKENLFSKIRLDDIHHYFILSAFHILYEKHNQIEKSLLERQVYTLLSGRVYNVCSLSLYKQLEKIDQYIGKSSFALNFYEYHLDKPTFINKLNKYNIKSFHKKLDNTIEHKNEKSFVRKI